MITDPDKEVDDDVCNEMVEEVVVTNSVDQLEDEEEADLDADTEERSPASNSSEDYRLFQDIDRNQENKLVVEFHKTKSTKTLHKLLLLRDQTLRHMAKKYAYLDNEDDMYSEFKGVWLKCIKKYDIKPQMRPLRSKDGTIIKDEHGKTKMISKSTPFNTYLYTSMRYRICNILKRRNCKRFLDGNGNPVSETTLSLDYQLDQGDGEMTLKDVVEDTRASKAYSSAELSEMMRYLGADKDPDIARTVRNYLDNPTLDSLPSASKFRVGTLKASKFDLKILSVGERREGFTPEPNNVIKAHSLLRQMIDSTEVDHKRYDVSSFTINQNRIDFVITVDDREIVMKIKEAMARCRKIIEEKHKKVSSVSY